MWTASDLLMCGSLLFANSVVTATITYHLDEAWQPSLQEGAGFFSAVDVFAGRIYVSQKHASTGVDPILVLDRHGNQVHSFGAGEIAINNGTYGGHGLAIQPPDVAQGREQPTVWVMDFVAHNVIAFSTEGEVQGRAGDERGHESCEPGAFGHVSDAAFRGDSVFFADGDGGSCNQVERWEAPAGQPNSAGWITPSAPPEQRQAEEFNNPHGITWHEGSDQLVVADRDNARLVLMDPSSGSLLGDLSCDELQLGPQGKPFGVRALKLLDADVLLVTTANHPPDDEGQFLHVLDVSTLGETRSCKTVVQSIPVPASICNVPHLMGIDQDHGDVYVTCVGEPNSVLLRYTVGNVI